jgi:DNA-binding NarL/FixJ family response regulator
MSIKVLLADDHAVVREGVRLVLEKSKGIEVVAEAGDGREALRLAEQFRPDVAVLDIAMPEMNGTEAARRLAEECPATRVVILSMHATAEHIHRALAAGALGYVLKESAGAEVVEAVRAAAAGRRFISARMSDVVYRDYARLNRGGAETPLDSLSLREREVMQLVVAGKSSKEIAALIHLSPKTVESYRSRLMAKLEVGDVTGLVKFAVAHGLTDPA